MKETIEATILHKLTTEEREIFLSEFKKSVILEDGEWISQNANIFTSDGEDITRVRMDKRAYALLIHSYLKDGVELNIASKDSFIDVGVGINEVMNSRIQELPTPIVLGVFDDYHNPIINEDGNRTATMKFKNGYHEKPVYCDWYDKTKTWWHGDIKITIASE